MPEKVKTGWDRDQIIEAINAEGVPCFSGSSPEIYKEIAYKNLGYMPQNRLEVARELGETSIMVNVHHLLEHDDMIDISNAIRKVIEIVMR